MSHTRRTTLQKRRTAEAAVKVKQVFEKYGLNYHEDSLPKQVYSAWHKVVRLSLPNGFLDDASVRWLSSDEGASRNHRRFQHGLA